MDNKVKKLPLSYILFVIVWIIFCLFSFTQKDLNLTIYNYPIVNSVILWLVGLGSFQKPIALTIFSILIIILFTLYFSIISAKNYPTFSKIKKFFLILFFSAIFAYPLFSHDIFNYLFNAKMILVYSKNPHIHTASEFLFDNWTRFMHNVHTPAPYAYGWTLISLIPVFLSIKNFTLSFWLTKIFISLFFIGEAVLIYKIYQNINPKKAYKKSLIFLLNPLLLTETLIVGHNDSVMMFFSLLSIYFLFYSKINQTKKYLLSILFWLLSVSIKYATVVLLPVYILKKIKKNLDYFLISGILLFAILLTRPDQIHSWYFHWGIVMLILSKNKMAVIFSILISISGLIRYAPYILFGTWDYPVSLLKTILILPPLLLLLFPKFKKLIA